MLILAPDTRPREAACAATLVEAASAAANAAAHMYGRVPLDKSATRTTTARRLVFVLDNSGSIGQYGPQVSRAIQRRYEASAELAALSTTTILWGTNAVLHQGFVPTNSDGGMTRPSEAVKMLTQQQRGDDAPVIFLFTDGDIAADEMRTTARLLDACPMHTLVAFVLSNNPRERLSVIMPFVSAAARSVVYGMLPSALHNLANGEQLPTEIYTHGIQPGESLAAAVDITRGASIPAGCVILDRDEDTVYYANADLLLDTTFAPEELANNRELQVAVLGIVRRFNCRGDSQGVERVRSWYARHWARRDFAAAMETHYESGAVANARAAMRTLLGEVVRRLRESGGQRDVDLDVRVAEARLAVTRAEQESQGEVRAHIERWEGLRRFSTVLNEALRAGDSVDALRTGLQAMGVATGVAARFKQTTTKVDDISMAGAHEAECTICAATAPASLLISDVPGDLVSAKTLDGHKFAGPHAFPLLRHGILPGLYCATCAEWLMTNGAECPLTRRRIHAVCPLLAGIPGADIQLTELQAERNRLRMRHELAACLVPPDAPHRPHVPRLGGLLLTVVGDPQAVPHLAEAPMREAIVFLAVNLARNSTDQPFEELTAAVEGDFFQAANADAGVLVTAAGLLLQRRGFLPSPPDEQGAVQRLVRAAVVRAAVLRIRGLWLDECRTKASENSRARGGHSDYDVRCYRDSYFNMRRFVRKGSCQYPHFHVKRLLRLVSADGLCENVDGVAVIASPFSFYYWRKVRRSGFKFDDEERAALERVFPDDDVEGLCDETDEAAASTHPRHVHSLELMKELAMWGNFSDDADDASADAAAAQVGQRAAAWMEGTYAREFAARNLGLEDAPALVAYAFGRPEDESARMLAVTAGLALLHVRGNPYEKLLAEMRNEMGPSGEAGGVFVTACHQPDALDGESIRRAWRRVVLQLRPLADEAKGAILAAEARERSAQR